MKTELPNALPIHLITGFLGSGKSTFINRVLREHTGQRIALVVNEFGDVGLESSILEASEDDIVELSGGCMCCLLRKDLKEAVQRLIRHDPDLERIIVEASGLSDPVPVFETFRSTRFSRPVTLESVLCLVDQTQFLEHRLEYQVLDRQLQAADFVLISKAELAPERGLELDTQLDLIAAGVPCYRIGSEPPLNLLLGSGVSPHKRLSDQISEGDHDGHHEDDVQQLWYRSEHPFDSAQLKSFFDSLPSQVVRAKGVLYLGGKEGKKNKFILQMSGARRELRAQAWKKREVRENIVLILGRGFDPISLRHKLEGCRYAN